MKVVCIKKDGWKTYKTINRDYLPQEGDILNVRVEETKGLSKFYGFEETHPEDMFLAKYFKPLDYGFANEVLRKASSGFKEMVEESLIKPLTF